MAEKPKSVADVLDAAADLIEPEGRWTQGALARDERGCSYTIDEAPYDAISNAACFCLSGAVCFASGGDDNLWDLGLRAVEASGIPNGLVAVWNDAPKRTQAEVVAVLRSAASLARNNKENSNGETVA